ncbi:MAG: IucA/IucC family protein [Candidatus Paceibacterota bacterium]
MKLHELDFKNPFYSSIYCERHVNDSKGRFNEYSEVNPIYDPQGSIPQLQVPFTWIQEENLEVYKSNPSLGLLLDVYKNGGYKFFWHPDTIRATFVINGYASMQPTSSTRTMLEMNTMEYYVKTDLDKKHFRFVRRLKKSSVIHSIEICNELHTLVSKLSADSTYSFLPESLGLVIMYGPYKESGVLFRETKPAIISKDNRMILPYHALYALDSNDLESKPLLIQLCEKNSPLDPLGFFLEYIVGYIQDAWVLLVTKRGLLPELHGQNSLIEIDENFFPKRIIHRDFQGTYSDSEIRKSLNLSVFKKHVAGEEDGTSKASQYSHVYDGMIGRYLFSRLTKTFCAHYEKFDYKTVSSEIARRFNLIPNNITDMFPLTTYKFGNSAKEQENNNVFLVDTKELPNFR